MNASDQDLLPLQLRYHGIIVVDAIHISTAMKHARDIIILLQGFIPYRYMHGMITSRRIMKM